MLIFPKLSKPRPAFLQALGLEIVERLARNWRNLVLTSALAIGLIIALGVRAHRRQTARFADLVELCLAMDQWRENPQGRSDQLPRLRQLFERQGAMLERFGGSFLQVAIAQAKNCGGPGVWARNRFSDQQQRWLTTPNALRRDFESVTLAAARENWSVATQISIREDGDFSAFESSPSPLSDLSNKINQELQTWHLMRALSVATLAQNVPARLRALAELRKLGQLQNIQIPGQSLQPALYQNFCAELRQGHLTFADWINSGATTPT